MLGGRRCTRAIVQKRPASETCEPHSETRTQKCTEPVALSSTVPVDRPLSLLASGSGFDLLALRARCKRDIRAGVHHMQPASKPKCRTLREVPFLADRVVFSPTCNRPPGRRRSGHARREKNSPSRWRFRPPSSLAFRFRVRPPRAASTYSRSVLGAGVNLRPVGRACNPPADGKICSLR